MCCIMSDLFGTISNALLSGSIKLYPIKSMIHDLFCPSHSHLNNFHSSFPLIRNTVLLASSTLSNYWIYYAMGIATVACRGLDLPG
jgi:hypothetical protein